MASLMVAGPLVASSRVCRWRVGDPRWPYRVCVWRGEGSVISHRGWMWVEWCLFRENSLPPSLTRQVIPLEREEKSSPVATERMCHAVTDWTAPTLELRELCTAAGPQSKYSAAEEFIGIYCVLGQMLPDWVEEGRFYNDLCNCRSVSCPSGCCPSFLLSVKLVGSGQCKLQEFPFECDSKVYNREFYHKVTPESLLSLCDKATPGRFVNPARATMLTWEERRRRRWRRDSRQAG